MQADWRLKVGSPGAPNARKEREQVLKGRIWPPAPRHTGDTVVRQALAKEKYPQATGCGLPTRTSPRPAFWFLG